MNNPEHRVRCESCGEVDYPEPVARGPGWIALALWVSVGVLWAVDFVVATSWLIFVAAVMFFAAFVYTLWYFYRREQACRHCGGRQLEPQQG